MRLCELRRRVRRCMKPSGEPAFSLSSRAYRPPLTQVWRHSVSRSRNGLGLGLHICSQIVRAHAGHISVFSTKELGTQFKARLPLRMQTVQLPFVSIPP
jgi:hypothetical protein